MPYALSPIPYPLCTSEHVTEKGYNYVLLNLPPFMGSDQSQEKPFVSATN